MLEQDIAFLPPPPGLVNGPIKTSRLPWAGPLIGTRKGSNFLKVILFAHNSSIQASTEYGREPQLLTEITETPPDVVEVVEPDQNSSSTTFRHGLRRMWRFLTRT
ncbi:uncharacterized protein ACWYII_011781 isoform 1-T1 [Salvelinus alpinus]